MLASLSVPLSWKEIAVRTWNEIWADDLLDLAAQQAYYFFFALFPALLTFISLASFFPIDNMLWQRHANAPCRRSDHSASRVERLLGCASTALTKHTLRLTKR